MVNLQTINTIEQLQQSLIELSKEGKNLLTEDEIIVGRNHFQALLQSPLVMNNLVKPIEILKSITNAEMHFNITENPQLLANLMNTPILNNEVGKKHYNAMEILAKDFALKADTIIPFIPLPKTMSEFLIEHSASNKVSETLDRLVQAKLLPKIELMAEYALLPQSIANAIANKVTNKNDLLGAIKVLSKSYDLQVLAESVVKSWYIPLEQVFDAFTKSEIVLDCNKNGQDGTNILEAIINKNTMMQGSDIARFFESIKPHNIDFTQIVSTGANAGHNFLTAILHANAYMTPEQVLFFATELGSHKLELSSKVNVNGIQTSALKMISDKLPAGTKSNKEVVKAIVYNNHDIKFEEIFAAFKDKVPVDRIVKYYADTDKLKEVDFNTPSVELAYALNGAMMPIGNIGMMMPIYQPTTLLREVFGYVNNQNQFTKVMEWLKQNDLIDWGQELNGMGGNSIFAKFSYFYNVPMENYLEVLTTIKEQGIAIKLNHVNALKFVTDRITHNTDLQELIEQIERLGVKIDTGAMTIALASSRGKSLIEAAALMPSSKLQTELNTSDLSNIPNTLNFNNDALTIKANIMQLEKIGFNQWEGNFGNSNHFLHEVLSRSRNLDDIEVSLTFGAKLKLDINVTNQWNQTPLDLVLMRPEISNSDGLSKIFKLLGKFKNIDWEMVVGKVLDIAHMLADPQHINALLEPLTKEIDITKMTAGQSLLSKFVSKVHSLEMLEHLMTALEAKLEFKDLEANFGNGNHFLHEALNRAQGLEKIEYILTLGSKLGLDPNVVNQVNQTPLDIVVQKIEISSEGALPRIFALLEKFEHVDWARVVDKALNTFITVSEHNISALLKPLTTETDITKITEGRSLLSKIMEKIDSSKALEAFIVTIKEQFNFDINAKIGEDEVSIFTQLKPKMINFATISYIGKAVGVEVNFKSTSKNGTPLFVTLINRTDNALLKENVKYLISNLQINLNDELDLQGNNLPLILGQNISLESLSLIRELVLMTDKEGLPLFNVNHKNTNGYRLIDQVMQSLKAKILVDESKLTITNLRINGSVEPKEHIVKDLPKLDISNGRLDSYEPNKIAVVKLVNALCALLDGEIPGGFTPAKITEILDTFKARDYTGYDRNIDWHAKTADHVGELEVGEERINLPGGIKICRPLTIPQVVTEFDKLTDVSDRLPHKWNFKKVLAAAVYLAEKNGKGENLCDTLAQLQACNLGKLINVMYLVQDDICNGKNYEAQTFESYAPMFENVYIKIAQLFKDQTNKVVTDWMYDILSKNPAENWSLMTMKIQALITAEFIETMKPEFYSYDFESGLKGYITHTLIAKIQPGANSDDHLLQWQSAIQYGSEERLKSIFIKASTYPNLANVEDWLDEIALKPEMNYGNFSNVSLGFLKKEYLNFYKTNSKLAPEILIKLANNATFTQEIQQFMSQELTEAFIKEEITLEKYVECWKLRSIKPEVLGNDMLIDLLKIKEISILLLNDDKIDWLSPLEAKEGETNTLLSELAKLSPDDANKLYNSHMEEWSFIVNHDIEMGMLGAHFGELI